MKNWISRKYHLRGSTKFAYVWEAADQSTRREILTWKNDPHTSEIQVHMP